MRSESDMSKFIDQSILFLTLLNSIILGVIVLGFAREENSPFIGMIGLILCCLSLLVIGKMIFESLITQPLNKYADAYKTQLETQLKTSEEHQKETNRNDNE
jgi:hypothetical protein